MKAAVHTRYGPSDVVRVTDVEKPTVTDNEVLVKVCATTVNRMDCAYRAAKPFFVRLFTGLTRPKVTVLGNEFAGEVEAVGHDVTAFGVGYRVFGYNEGPFGAHADYLTIPEDGSLAAMPENTTVEEAAPGTEGRTTHSRSSGRRRSGAGRTSSSMARPEASAQRRSSSW